MFRSVPTRRRVREGRVTEAALGREWELNDRPLGIAAVTAGPQVLEPGKPELFFEVPRGPQFTHSNLGLKPECRPHQAAPTTSPWPTATPTLLHSDSEMEMEAEHYPNGVLESMSTRIVNGAYKHEDLQTDESSMGEGHAPAWCSVGVTLGPDAPSP